MEDDNGNVYDIFGRAVTGPDQGETASRSGIIYRVLVRLGRVLSGNRYMNDYLITLKT